MKIIPLTCIVSLAAVAAAQASLYSTGTILDGNPTGTSFVGTYDGAPSGATVSGLTVNLNLSSGYNGDLYAYLVSPTGTLVLLMNQPGVSVNGFGASGAGMNLTLTDSTTDPNYHGSIQNETSSSYLTGSYNAAGSLASFNGSAANGTWTLFFADLSSGGGNETLNGWSLNLTAVPEPVNGALAILGGSIGILALGRFITRRQLKNPASR